MAFTERYVTQAAAGGGAGTSGDPWTLAEAFANAASGDRVNIQSDGAYSLGATTQTNAGDAANLIVFRGYNSTIGDLEGQGRNADGTLDTTNFPAITLTGQLQPNSWTVLQNLNFTSSLASVAVGNSTGNQVHMVSCKSVNSGAGGSAFQTNDHGGAVNCDFECSNTNRWYVVDCDNNNRFIGCRFKTGGTDTDPMLFTGQSAVVMNCVFIGTGAEGGYENFDVGGMALCVGNTFYNCTTAIKLTISVNNAMPWLLINNHITDCTVGIDGNTNANAIMEFNSRTRDNTTAARQNLGDGLNVGEVTTDTGGAETDFVAAGSGNFRLISGAPGESAGLIAYADIGAYQRQPSAAGGGLLTHPGMTGGMRG